MTVLEKIKRCVELVWDFEEIYDWSDIEAFCGAELSTYPQHDEILNYFKHIENLEKENAELKGIKDVATLIRANNDTVTTLMQLNNRLVSANQLINKLKKCDNCKENTTMNPYCIDCENHSKWELEEND